MKMEWSSKREYFELYLVDSHFDVDLAAFESSSVPEKHGD
jgi:hypothetical protein